MTEKEALTKLYQSQTKSLQRIESKLIKEPYKRTEYEVQINFKKGVINGVKMSLEAIQKLEQFDFDDMLSAETR